MVLRTILRSLLVVAMNILVMYMNIEPPNPFWHFFAWNLRAYVLLRMLNLDILLDLGEIKESTRSGSDSDGRKSGSTQQPLVVSSSSQIFKSVTIESRRASRIVKG
ncbi:hypothetical protein HDU79_005503 [Rhizoclosmatium sp. JEL0117]|nr:hypothetical protein HDU79_005503 [Rhizoclosmatium sp. JEL0117]